LITNGEECFPYHSPHGKKRRSGIDPLLAAIAVPAPAAGTTPTPAWPQAVLQLRLIRSLEQL